jgi:hypothetical protein
VQIAFAGKTVEHLVQNNDWNFFDKQNCQKCGGVVAVYMTRDVKPPTEEQWHKAWEMGLHDVAVNCPGHDAQVIYQTVSA